MSWLICLRCAGDWATIAKRHGNRLAGAASIYLPGIISLGEIIHQFTGWAFLIIACDLVLIVVAYRGQKWRHNAERREESAEAEADEKERKEDERLPRHDTDMTAT